MLTIILASREMVQLAANIIQGRANDICETLSNGFKTCKQHFSGVENIVEACMFASAGVVLSNPCTATELKRYFSAVLILFSWSVLMTMVGRYPRFSRFNGYLTMFYKVQYLLYLTKYIPQR